MNNHCTPETAKKLKALGFPQPKPAPGQVWYEQDGTAVFMIEINSFTGLVHGSNGVRYGGKASEVLTFAPTAPDILKQIAHEYTLAYVPEDKQWFCCTTDEETGNLTGHMSKNPAEACAEALVAQNKNQTLP